MYYSDRVACSIPDPDLKELVITGGHRGFGFDALTQVSVYNESGWQRNLTQLTQGRWRHACSSYTHKGEKVIFLKLLIF